MTGLNIGNNRAYQARSALTDHLPTFTEEDIDWKYQIPVIPEEHHDKDVIIFYHQARREVAQKLGLTLGTHGVLPEEAPQVHTQRFSYVPDDVFHNQAYFAVDTVYKDVLSEKFQEIFSGQELMIDNTRFPGTIDLVLVLYDYHSSPQDPIYPKLIEGEDDFDAVILYQPHRRELAQKLSASLRECSLLPNKKMLVTWQPLDEPRRALPRTDKNQIYFSGAKIHEKRLLDLVTPIINEPVFKHSTGFAGEIDVLVVLN